MTFEEGDMVEIVRHLMDSEEAFDIGDVAEVLEVDTNLSQIYLLKSTRRGAWWVHKDCVGPVDLENI